MKYKKQQLQKIKNERGLTLVELLAVIVILGIISTIAFVMIGNVIDNAKKDAHIANAQQLISSAKLYEANGGDITDGVSAAKLHKEGLIEKITDPWSKKTTIGDGESDTPIAGSVTKSTGDSPVYSVTLDASKDDYNIKSIDEETLNQGREAVWP